MQSSDLREAAAMRRLARGANVFSSSYRPSVNTRFGCCPRNPRLQGLPIIHELAFVRFIKRTIVGTSRQETWVSEQPELYAPTFPLVRTNNAPAVAVLRESSLAGRAAPGREGRYR